MVEIKRALGCKIVNSMQTQGGEIALCLCLNHTEYFCILNKPCSKRLEIPCNLTSSSFTALISKLVFAQSSDVSMSCTPFFTIDRGVSRRSQSNPMSADEEIVSAIFRSSSSSTIQGWISAKYISL